MLLALADHLYQGLQDKDGKKEELICEWNKFKYNLLNLQKELPQEIARPKAGHKTPTEWTLEHLMRMSSTYQTPLSMSALASRSLSFTSSKQCMARTWSLCHQKAEDKIAIHTKECNA